MMNTYINWKNWYGAVGLISTVGKNGFAAGETISGLVKGGCHYVQKVVDIDVVVVGPVFKKLENVFESIEGFDKSAKEWFEEKATSANEKWEQAKRDEDWRQVNEKYKNVEAEPKVHINLEEDQTWDNTSKNNTTYLPSCFRSWRV